MPLTDFCCGAECGITGSGSTPSPDARHWNLIGTAPTAQATIARNSGLAYRFTPTAAANSLRHILAAGSNTRWMRFYIRFATLPDIDTTLAMFEAAAGAGSSPQLRFKVSNSTIIAGVSTTTTGATGFVVTTGVWYRIELKADVTADPGTCQLWVNGVDQGTATKTQAATTFLSTRIGPSCSGQLATADVIFDDFLTGTNNADLPIGDGQIVGLLPNEDGAHSFAAAGSFKYLSAGGNVATDATDTYTYVDHQLDTITDFLRANSLTQEYLEWGFADITATPNVINGLEVVSAHHNPDGTANKQSGRIWDGTTEAVVFTDSDFSNTTLTYNSAHFTYNPTSGIDWLKSEVNALRFRWGSSWSTVDVSPTPYIDAVMLEVDFAPLTIMTGSGSPVATLSKTASGTASLRFNASGSPAKTLSKTASGTASQRFNASGSPVKTLASVAAGAASLRFNASGSPVKTLAPVASGTATSTSNRVASGSPVATLSAYASGTVTRSVVSVVAGGGRRTHIHIVEDEPRPKKRRRRRRPETPAVEAAERVVAALEPLPEVAPRHVNPEAWGRIQAVVRVEEILAKKKAAHEPITDVDEALLRHFIEVIGKAPAYDTDEDMPFMLKRFLRMGQENG